MVFDTVRTREGEPLAWTSGSAWGIPRGSANPEAGCRFAKAMTETDSWVKAAEERIRLRQEEDKLFTGLLTGNTEADEQIEGLIEPGGDEKWDTAVAKIYEANENTFALPANPAGEEFEAAWQDAVNRVLNGQQEPQAAMEQAQKEAQEALDEAWAAFEE